MHPLFTRAGATALALLCLTAQAESKFSFGSTPGKLPKDVALLPPTEY